MKIILLICDEFPGILTPDIPSYEWMFENMFRACGFNCEFEVYHAFDGELPNHLNRSDLYLISGSTDDSFGDKAWIIALREWIRDAYRRGCKMTGICFGHQIIAEALGGKTERSTKGWGIGLRESHVVDSEFQSRLLKYNNVSKSGNYTLIYDHHDQVVRLPKDATLVSGSDFCPVESYRIGRQVLTFQGHPEFTDAFIRHWIEDCAPEEPQDVKNAALHSLDVLENQSKAITRCIIDFFGT